MSGRFKGVQARLKEVCPDSVYVHCANHSLDLVLQEVAREMCLVAGTLNFVLAKTKEDRERSDLKPPHPPRITKPTARFLHTEVEEEQELSSGAAEYPNVWKRELFEALDLVRSEVEQRFDQDGLQMAVQREQAVIRAAQGKEVDVGGSPELKLFAVKPGVGNAWGSV
ncbi:unnamed protein product [Arctogadus glacialis]